MMTLAVALADERCWNVCDVGMLYEYLGHCCKFVEMTCFAFVRMSVLMRCNPDQIRKHLVDRVTDMVSLTEGSDCV